jgi:hypothetical protein
MCFQLLNFGFFLLWSELWSNNTPPNLADV